MKDSKGEGNDMKRLVSFTVWRNSWKTARIDTKVVVQTKKLVWTRKWKEV